MMTVTSRLTLAIKCFLPLVTRAHFLLACIDFQKKTRKNTIIRKYLGLVTLSICFVYIIGFARGLKNRLIFTLAKKILQEGVKKAWLLKRFFYWLVCLLCKKNNYYRTGRKILHIYSTLLLACLPLASGQNIF